MTALWKEKAVLERGCEWRSAGFGSLRIICLV